MAKNEVMTTEEKKTVAVVAPQVEVEQEDMMVPFLKVIQSLAEEVMPGKDKYNADVRPGDIYDGVTRTVFRNAKAIICGLKKYYAEWTPEVRGTLVAKHKADSDTVKNAEKVAKTTEKGGTFYQLKTADGNDLIETYGVVMIIKNEDGMVLPAVLTLSKTSFMVGKQLTTILAIHQQKGVPVFKLSTTSASNAKGSWFKPVFTFDSYEEDSDTLSMMQGMIGMVDHILFGNFGPDVAAPVDNDIL